MEICVKLQAFEGPLDLLLHLIDKNKVNIYDIPIVMITKQYMEYISQMDKEDLDVISEFLVMAATLLDIKSKMLLPKEINEKGEEQDPRTELVERLLEYKLCKYISYQLKEKQACAERSFYKASTVPKEIEAYKPPIDLNELIKDTTLIQEEKVDPIRSKFGKIEKEKVSVSERFTQIKNFLKTKKTVAFEDMLMNNHSKISVIVSFLVLLELMKTGFISVSQENICGDIQIDVIKDPDLIDIKKEA